MMNNLAKRLLIAVLVTIAALCTLYFISEYVTAKEEVREYDDMRDSFTTLESELVEEKTIHASSNNLEQSETAGLPYTVVDFDALLKVNPETMGWVAIPDSLISYPVMQAKDNKKYLNTSSSGARSSAGAVFMDKNNGAVELDKNTVLYGHNMGHGRTDMFGTLLHYNEKEYYDTHRYIQFDTATKQYGWWKIFAVINMDIKAGDFNYLRLNFKDDVEFMQWIDAAKGLSLYDTGVEVARDDMILTLSTCDRTNYGRSGRQLILAVRIGS